MADQIDPKERSTENMEYRIAEPALWVLDYVGRMCGAIKTGDWDEVEDTAMHLSQRAIEVAQAASEAAKERRPRAVAVVEMMTRKTNPENNLFRYAAGLTGSPAGLTVGLSSGIAATGKTIATAHIDVQPGPDVLLVDTDPQPGARDLTDPTHPFRRGSGEGAS